METRRGKQGMSDADGDKYRHNACMVGNKKPQLNDWGFLNGVGVMASLS